MFSIKYFHFKYLVAFNFFKHFCKYIKHKNLYDFFKKEVRKIASGSVYRVVHLPKELYVYN